MSTDGEAEEDEEHFEVERILYQQPGIHPDTHKPTTLYLVKWDGFPEEQCTWEPRDHFDSVVIFNEWAKQWADGDILDHIDLKRVEDQMAAWQAGEAANSAAQESAEDSDAFYHVPSEAERSPKRQKLVHNAPLVKKNKTKKGIARPVAGRSITPENSKKTNLKPIRSVSPAVEPVRVRTAAPPLHRPSTASTKIRPKPLEASSNSRGNVRANTLPTRQPGSTRPVVPQASRLNTAADTPVFHAIDLPQRRRADAATLEKRREERIKANAENNKDKPFRNFSHQNAVRKKMREAQYVPPPPPSSRLVPAEQISQSVEPSCNTVTENVDALFADETGQQTSKDCTHVESDAARLFFSDSDEDIKPEINHNDEDSLLRAVQAEGRDSSQMSTGLIVQASEPIKKQLQDTQLASNREASPPISPDSKHPQLAVDTRSNVSNGAVEPPKEAAETPTLQSPAHIKIPTGPRNGSVHQNNIRPEVRRKSSTLNGALIAEDLPNSAPAVSPDITLIHNHVAAPVLPAIRPHPIAPNHTPPHNASWQSRQSFAPTGPKLRFKDDDMTREFVKGDLLCHMVFSNNLSGAVKLRHASKVSNQRVLSSRAIEDIRNKKLLLEFRDQMTYEQYQRRNGTSWFSYLDSGILEPFDDTKPLLTSFADLLEQSNTAVFWYHPSADFMGVLYPCRSHDWQNLGAKPGCDFDTRLCIAFRQKFPEQPVVSPLESHPMSTISPVQVADPRRRPGAATTPQVRRSSLEPERTVLDQRQQQSTDELSRRRSSMPPIQKVPVTNAQVINTVSVVASDAMDVDEQPGAMTKLGASADGVKGTAVQVQTSTKAFPGIDWSLEDLASVSKPNAEKRKVWVLLACNKDMKDDAQRVRHWLIEKGQPWEQILDINDRKHRDQFRAIQKTSKVTWVILFDKLHQMNTFGELGHYIPRTDYILCWQFDYKASTTAQLGMIKLYPSGMAISISEPAYISRPYLALILLKFLRHYVREVQKPYASSVLVLPPKIINTVLKESSDTKSDSDARLLREIASVILELMNMKRLSMLDRYDAAGPEHGGFQVIDTDWAAVYKDISEQREISINDIQRQNRSKEGNLNLWFSAWALMNLDRHRKFFGVRAVDGTAPGSASHVRWVKIEQYVEEIYPGTTSSKERLHDRDRGRTEHREERARSRSVSAGSSFMRTPTTPAFRN